jgi:hypothetical protein
MTHLRKMMLEELQRRITLRVQQPPTSAPSKISHGTSSVGRTSWAGAHPRVSGTALQQAKTGPQHGDATAGGLALLLR